MLDLVTTIPLTMPGSPKTSATFTPHEFMSNQTSTLPISQNFSISFGFDKYVLATSPPDFELMKLQTSSRNLYISDYLNFSTEESCNNYYSGASVSSFYDDISDSYYNDSRAKPSWSKEDDWERICNWELHYVCTSTQDGCGCQIIDSSPSKRQMRKRKWVCFADDRGLNLCETKLITEAPDVPPTLSQKEVSEQKPQKEVPEKKVQKEVPEPKSPIEPIKECKYNFVLNFSQPASDYVAFRARLEDSFVLLENVIVKPTSVQGRVRVRNLSYEKLVKAHVTFDDWQNSSDFHATYVSSTTAVGTNFDVFSFEIDLPNDLPTSAKVQFALCYVSEDKSYWDNNSGHNYELIQKIDRQAKKRASLESDLKTLGCLDNLYSLCGVTCRSSNISTVPYW